jgi:hypothetical protein
MSKKQGKRKRFFDSLPAKLPKHLREQYTRLCYEQLERGRILLRDIKSAEKEANAKTSYHTYAYINYPAYPEFLQEVDQELAVASEAETAAHALFNTFEDENLPILRNFSKACVDANIALDSIPRWKDVTSVLPLNLSNL